MLLGLFLGLVVGWSFVPLRKPPPGYSLERNQLGDWRWKLDSPCVILGSPWLSRAAAVKDAWRAYKSNPGNLVWTPEKGNR